MQFTYKIENYYPSENRLFVIYTPSDTALEPYGAWVSINADMNESQIKDAIVYNLPTYKWLSTKSVIAESLVGATETATKADEPLAPPIVIPSTVPQITEYQKIIEGTPGVRNDGNYTQVWIVQDLVGDELLAAQANHEENRKAMLWGSAHNVEFNAISGSAIGLITMGVLAEKPKCLAVQAWIQTLWAEYYVRKATASENYDFSAYNNCPHTVPELMAELGL